ncbi:FAD-dependent oxidoreductase [Nocardioides sp. Iso805N]|uniref:FAD-dependent oxidoreductase n=1 Tax=Nocardioides sp. Iso805N TaxID=1283287 RepID=UPI00037C02CA|nr:FAD-dependent oxidoreductase [Nocardioides sp. Iso805N]
MQHTRARVAVIGSGVAGLVAAYECRDAAEVTLYEAADRLGGHADTHEVREGGRTLAIDTGFIVHNLRTYPVLTRMFEELGVDTQASEMSMSISDPRRGLEWAGARGLRGVFPTAARLTDTGHLRMLAEIPRFHRRARALLAADDGAPGRADQTLASFLTAGGFSERFVRDFMEPLVAAVWSCDPQVATVYPARYLFRFLEHHGMLSITGSPTWRTVTGGSREYVRRIAERIDAVRLGSPVVEVLERSGGVSVRTEDGTAQEYDAVVIATHPGQALAMLADPTPLQQEVLGAMTYSTNTAILHTDTTLLPQARRAWSSWNFRRVRDEEGPVVVTYDLTRLQRLDTDRHYLVTLGGEDLIDPDTVIDRMSYEHPLYTPESVAAQGRLPEIETPRIAFAGAYHGWGFHEDGARAGLAAAHRLGFAAPMRLVTAPAAEQVPEQAPAEPLVYATTVRHLRRTPWRREFVNHSTMWVVDLDRLPATSTRRERWRAFWRGSIAARDHLGDPTSTVRENLAAFLAGHGVELGRGRVLLAAHPRAFGFCFNPISVFWCEREDGSPLATVVEVHNTYGDRHAYLLDPERPAPLAKQMYVSPFHGVDGEYDVRAPAPTEQLDIAVRLRTADGAAFNASLQGRRVDPGSAAARIAGFAGIRDALLIRLHGIRLWTRGLPIHNRPVHHQEGVR